MTIKKNSRGGQHNTTRGERRKTYTNTGSRHESSDYGIKGMKGRQQQGNYGSGQGEGGNRGKRGNRGLG